VVEPDFDQFRKLAADYSVVPLHEEFVADSITPVGAFLTVVGDGDGFPARVRGAPASASADSFVGRSPVSTVRVAHGRELSVVKGELPSSAPLDQGILACLEDGPFVLPLAEDRGPAPRCTAG